jgi:hypothetical protein
VVYPTFQRETDDWAEVPVTHQGQAYTDAWSYQIVPWRGRPTGSWTTAKISGAAKGFDISGLAPGYYWLFIRIDGQAPYAPELNPQIFVIE